MHLNTSYGVLVFLAVLRFGIPKQLSDRIFKIDYAGDTFSKDGKPFRYISGSIHYSRIHPDYWEDRLTKMRAAGLNAIETYIPWNFHEKNPGVYDWEGKADVFRFLDIAQKLDFVVILRPGPYICGEWEFGGLPAWLLSKDPYMVVRTSDPSYYKWAEKWMTVLYTKIKPYLYKNGGPIITVQIENEYGSYFACDRNYTLRLSQLARRILGENVVLFTTDGDGEGFIKCGRIENVYTTVDFGLKYDPKEAFAPQRKVEPKGPLVNSEFYSGWLDHWGEKHSVVDMFKLSKSLDILLDYGANINMYMFEGGTNFGFWNGANSNGFPNYQPVPTSYDYDAPLSEAGDTTLKYFAVRNIILKYLPRPPVPVPENTNKSSYGPVSVKFVSTVFDLLEILSPEGPIKSKYPTNMEAVNFYHGFILYRHVLKKDYIQETVLHCGGIRDRGMVLVNSKPVALMDRTSVNINITGRSGDNLDIFVENQGRIGFGSSINFNLKGIIEPVLLESEVLTDWDMYPIHVENIKPTLFKKIHHRELPKKSNDGKLHTPSIFTGVLDIPESPNQPQDTYLDPSGFGKGQTIVNGVNIGRYWPSRGPQVTLYIPKPVLTKSANHIFLLEIERSPCLEALSTCNVTFTDKPYINAPPGPGALTKP